MHWCQPNLQKQVLQYEHMMGGYGTESQTLFSGAQQQDKKH